METTRSNDAAVVAITVIHRALLKDYVTIVINDGRKRLLRKEKAYRLLVEHAPRLAAQFQDLLAREVSFLFLVESQEVEELRMDEAARQLELIAHAREAARVGSNDVMEEAARVRQETRSVTSTKSRSLETFEDFDRRAREESQHFGYDPAARMRDPSIVRRRSRFHY